MTSTYSSWQQKNKVHCGHSRRLKRHIK